MKLLKYFAYEHLPDHLQAVSKPFHDLAEALGAQLPDGYSKQAALQKLLEAKDAAVRSIAVDGKDAD